MRALRAGTHPIASCGAASARHTLPSAGQQAAFGARRQAQASRNPELNQQPDNLHRTGCWSEPQRAEGPYYPIALLFPSPFATPPYGAPASAVSHVASHVHPDMDYFDGAANTISPSAPPCPPACSGFSPHIPRRVSQSGFRRHVGASSPSASPGDWHHAPVQSRSNDRCPASRPPGYAIEPDGTLLTQETRLLPCVTVFRRSPRQGGLRGSGPIRHHTGGHFFKPSTGRFTRRSTSVRAATSGASSNSSAVLGYDLSLTEDTTGADIAMHVLAIDGVTIDAQQGIGMAAMNTVLATSSSPWSCPGVVNNSA